jgi:hypothetical protein
MHAQRREEADHLTPSTRGDHAELAMLADRAAGQCINAAGGALQLAGARQSSQYHGQHAERDYVAGM